MAVEAAVKAQYLHAAPPPHKSHMADALEVIDSRLNQNDDGVAPVERVKCPVCKQSIPKGTFGKGHKCAAVEETNRDFLLLYQCVRCGDVFTGMSNIGNWQCMMHPGKYTLEGYTCCGRKKIEPTNPAVHNMVWKRRNQPYPDPFDAPPCTPCDHLHHSMPDSTNALKKSLDVQRDLPDQVFANLTPMATDRRGIQIIGPDDNRVAVLAGRDLCPTEKKGGSLL